MKARLLVTFAVGIALICGSAAAQPPMGGGGFPGGGMPPMGGGFPGGGGMRGMGMMYNGGVVDMTALANAMAEQMGRQLDLTPQQVKKIAKLNKKELDRRMNHMHSVGVPRMNFEPGMGPGMGGPGGPGMGRPRMGQMPPEGFPGFGEQEETQIDPESEESPELQQGRAAMSRLEALEETQADVKARIKIEKKMKKILTDEQYARWSARRDGRHNFQLRPEAEFNLDNIPEELREQFLERIRKGGYHEVPQGAPGAPGQTPAPGQFPFIPQE